MTEHLLNSFPPDRIQKAIFVPGGAFRKKHEYRDEGQKKRFFFILNESPEKDDRLILVTPTTKIKERKQRRSAEVLVEITPQDYFPLQSNSVIDCESCLVQRKDLIEEQIRRHEIEPLQPVPQTILDHLRRAVSFSKTLAPIDKRLVLGEEGS